TVSWPVVKARETEIVLNPVAFELPGFGFSRGLEGLPATFQADHQRVCRKVLRLIERFDPISFGHLAAMLRVVAFKPPPNGDYANLSHSELPGAVVLSVSPEPYILAAGLIHEVHHNRLFCIEELGPFFDPAGPDPLADADYYSPWREDLRPLHGILHAVYVFIPVFRFWSTVLATAEIPRRLLGFVRQRLASLSAQLRIGIAQLRRYAQFTEFGAAVFEEICREVERLEVGSAQPARTLDLPVMILDESGSFAAELNPSTGRPLMVRERLLRHLREHDLHRQCSEGWLVKLGHDEREPG
ncbi:MAG: aKG-HExxH-type peptide beta-hydroxylase, partial [Candidatus Binatia bacterium]